MSRKGGSRGVPSSSRMTIRPTRSTTNRRASTGGVTNRCGEVKPSATASTSRSVNSSAFGSAKLHGFWSAEA